MDAQQAAIKRKNIKKLFIDVVERNSPERIPLVANDSLWKVNDAGEKFSVALTDYDRLFEICCEFHERYMYDSYSGYSARNQIGFVNALGKNNYIVKDDPNSIYIMDSFLMHDDEYDELISKGLVRYFFDKLLVRQYGYTSREEALEKFKKALAESDKYFAYCVKTGKYFKEFYGICNFGAYLYFTPFEQYTKCLRGIKAISTDMRRRPELVSQGLEVMDKMFWEPYKKNIEALEPSDNYIFESTSCLIGYTLMNPKQFEKFYWPYLKKFFDKADELNHHTYLYMEGSMKNTVDFFRDMPKGRLALWLEQDDPKEIKNALPNATVIGGFPTVLLGNGSVSQCVDKAKELMDDLGFDGNWIFSQDKMLSYPNDAKRENMLAVNDYIRNAKL